MLLSSLFGSDRSLRLQVPPEEWEADTRPADLLPLLGSMRQSAGMPESVPLTVGIANVVVPDDLGSNELSASVPPPGEYVALTVEGPGSWTADWRWLPQKSPDASGPPLPPAQLLAAGVRFAYGRALGRAASITLFLPRRPPMPSGRASS